jgi:sugar phosphate permease
MIRAALFASLAPYRAAIYAGALVAIVAALLWYRASLVEQGRVEGRTEVQAQWDKAVQQAKDQQAQANTAATAELVKIVEVEKLVYQDRIKKVNVYVPAPATSCPIDADFERLFNNTASPAGGAGAK